MFEDLIKEMGSVNALSVSVDIETDENGYIDKQCPNKKCEFIFKVNGEDWVNIFNDDAVWCPLCRHEATSDQWFTADQVEHAKSEAFSVVKGKIDNAMRSGAKKFNQRQPKNSFISMSLKVSGAPERTYTIPAKAADLMQLEIQCESCESRFAVIGSAYFCPACGHNSVTRTFRDSLRKIRAKKNSSDIIKQAIIASSGKDEAELICRSLIETCINDGVVAFQKYCEGMYKPYGNAKHNVFQRLQEASELWENATKKGFDSWLNKKEIDTLNTLYQKRHLLAHSEGIVDAKYIQKSRDKNYEKGQRIIISTTDVEDLLTILDKLSTGIEKVCKPG
jgi:rRNA maturation endonuclease Nob1